MEAAKILTSQSQAVGRSRSADGQKKAVYSSKTTGGVGYKNLTNPVQPQTNATRKGKTVKFESSGYNNDYLQGGQQQMKPPYVDSIPGEEPRYVSGDSNKMTFGRPGYMGPQDGDANLRLSNVGSL